MKLNKEEFIQQYCLNRASAVVGNFNPHRLVNRAIMVWNDMQAELADIQEEKEGVFLNLEDVDQVKEYLHLLPNDWRGRIYPPEFKQQVVEFIIGRDGWTKWCNAIGINYQIVYTWKEHHRIRPYHNKGAFTSMGTVVRFHRWPRKD